MSFLSDPRDRFWALFQNFRGQNFIFQWTLGKSYSFLLISIVKAIFQKLLKEKNFCKKPQEASIDGLEVWTGRILSCWRFFRILKKF